MAIPTPTIPSAITPVSAVELKPTNNNKAFYIYSGLVNVPHTSDEVTLISVNDIGKRDVLIHFEFGNDEASDEASTIYVKSNGTTIYKSYAYMRTRYGTDRPEICFILPANTSIEVTADNHDSASNWTVAGYGYYLEGF